MYRLFLSFLLLSLQAYASDNKIMPSELYEVASQHQCEAISNFFDDPSAVAPPYVYGYLDGDARDSAVFLCRFIEDKKRYKLVVYSRKATDFSCPHEIEILSPVGLSLQKSETLLLRGFYYLGNHLPLRSQIPLEPVPEATVKNVTLITNFSPDGTGYDYLCYQGRWISSFWH